MSASSSTRRRAPVEATLACCLIAAVGVPAIAAGDALLPEPGSTAEPRPPAEDPLAPIRARLSRRHPEVGRRVLAFYYPWYGTEAFGGAERHWGAWDAERRDAPASLRWPAGGPYDSCDPEVVARHMEDFAAAGLDGPVVSWWGPGRWSDRALPVILEEAAACDRVVTVYFEVVRGEGPTSASAASDLSYLARRYAKHEAWLRVGERPVIFLYGRAMDQLGAAGWVEALNRAREIDGTDWFAIADGIGPENAALFDGIHTYNNMGSYLGVPESGWSAVAAAHSERVIRLAAARQRLACATVVPGYDDTKIRAPGAALDRAGGRLYDAQWEQLVDRLPDWVLVTSYNEWHEGSEIEASAELGARYMEATSRWTARWRDAGPRDPGEAAAPAKASPLKEILADRLHGKLGLLGGLGPAGLALVEVTEEIELIGPAALVAGEPTPKTHPLLIYVGGENYPLSVEREGDVPAALRAFLKSGGSLLVFGTGPVPFYYDEQGRHVDAGRRFGLNLLVGEAEPGSDGPRGFERPPEGSALHWSLSPRLASLPRTLPFPITGDLRWRPMVPSGDPDAFVPLIELLDFSGRSFGCGAAVLQVPGGGRLVYAWFGLADAAPLELLLAELIEEALPGGR